jgi:5-deoxy-glucuronate isomerase
MSTTTPRWVYRRGDLARDGWESVVDGSIPGWAHTGLRVAELAEGADLHLEAAGEERIVVPLAGAFTVVHDDGGGPATTRLHGRASVLDGPTDVLYLSSRARATISGTGRLAVASAPTDIHLPSRYLPADGVPIELRGAGASSRQVHNFGTPDALPAARLIVCEVLTPAGNWSSYPPHKHDDHVEGHESRLEEIYYFDVVAGNGASPSAAPFGLFSVSSSPAGEIAVDARIGPGDIVLVPYGYHGPAVAAPGYDMYYLNVMAGPGPDREWLITDDPAHSWVRGTWLEQDVDPRLPFGTEKKADL